MLVGQRKDRLVETSQRQRMTVIFYKRTKLIRNNGLRQPTERTRVLTRPSRDLPSVRVPDVTTLPRTTTGTGYGLKGWSRYSSKKFLEVLRTRNPRFGTRWSYNFFNGTRRSA